MKFTANKKPTVGGNCWTMAALANNKQKADQAHLKDLHTKVGQLTLDNDIELKVETHVFRPWS